MTRAKVAQSHEHQFHALWWNFGPYGPRDVHLHPCQCGVELVGDGAACAGQETPHAQYRYRRRWEAVTAARVEAMHWQDGA